jgi:hypothetical protein
MQIWVDLDDGLHVNLSQTKYHGKFVHSKPVMNCLADFCLQRRVDLNLDGGVTHICGVTEIRVKSIHMQANPAKKGGAWHDNIVLEENVNEHGIAFTICAKLNFFFFPESPDKYFAVIHPAYGYQPQYSVLTHMYQMEYEDDPANILVSHAHIDRRQGCWLLDGDQHILDSCPRLKAVSLATVKSHLLMIPSHRCSKYMLGIIDQSLWGDKFVWY